MKRDAASSSEQKKAKSFGTSDERLLATGRSQLCGSLSELCRYVCPIGVHAVVVLVVLLMLHVVEMVRHPLQITAPHEAAWSIMERIDIYTATTVVCLFCAYLVMQLGMLLVSGVKQTWRELFSSVVAQVQQRKMGERPRVSQVARRVSRSARRKQPASQNHPHLATPPVDGNSAHSMPACRFPDEQDISQQPDLGESSAGRQHRPLSQQAEPEASSIGEGRAVNLRLTDEQPYLERPGFIDRHNHQVHEAK